MGAKTGVTTTDARISDTDHGLEIAGIVAENVMLATVEIVGTTGLVIAEGETSEEVLVTLFLRGLDALCIILATNRIIDDRSRSPRRDGPPGPRNRSPPKGPRSDRDKERDKPRERRVSPPQPPKAAANGAKSSHEERKERRKKTDMSMEVDEMDEMNDMRKMMGFTGFKTTKNTKVPGNDRNYGVRKEKRTEYRQYMVGFLEIFVL